MTKQDEEQPLIKGGQGRSVEDIENSAAVVGLILAGLSGAIVLAIVLAIVGAC